MLFELIFVVLLVLTILTAIPTLYYLLLFVIYFFIRNNSISYVGKSTSKIVILIPAHNEETTIMKTINSCLGVDYPKDKYSIYVILDNCTDTTKKIVSDRDIKYFERNNLIQQGKGFALEWAFSELKNVDFDCILIVDADCELSRNSLLALDNYLAQGYAAMQLNDISSNPDASSLSYILSVGNFIENEYFSYPKNILNLAVQCRGTGMAFSRALLNEIPWDVNTVTEDMEYSIKIFRNNITVYFIKEAYVKSEFPDSNRKFFIQRTRWAEGNLSFSKSKAFSLLKEGIKNRKKLIFDAGFTLYVISKPLIILMTVISLTLSAIAYWLNPNFLMKFLFLTNSTIFSFLTLYFFTAIVFYGLSLSRLKKLFYVPVAITQLLKISLKGLRHNEKAEWNKTPRL